MVYHKDRMVKCPPSGFPHTAMILYTKQAHLDIARRVYNQLPASYLLELVSVIKKIKMRASESCISDAAWHDIEVRGNASVTQQGQSYKSEGPLIN